MSNYKNDCTNNFVNDLKGFNRTCLNFGYIQGTLEASFTDGDTNDICRQMFSDGLDFMFDIFCRLHNINETKGESKGESKGEIKEGIEDNVEKYEGMYNYESEDSNENSN